MGLDYAYKIYIQKESLCRTMEEIYTHSDKDRCGFEIAGSDLIRVNRFHNRTEKIKLINFGLNQQVETCLLFDSDDKIIEYYLYDLTQNYQSNSNDKSDFLDYYKVKDGRFWIGNIELKINDYSDKIEDTIELEFWAVTSDMSRLFTTSRSVEHFFSKFCKNVDAKYGCVYMEDAGYRLIWMEGREHNLTVPINWQSFQDFGFIRVIRHIFKV